MPDTSRRTTPRLGRVLWAKMVYLSEIPEVYDAVELWGDQDSEVDTTPLSIDKDCDQWEI